MSTSTGPLRSGKSSGSRILQLQPAALFSVGIMSAQEDLEERNDHLIYHE